MPYDPIIRRTRGYLPHWERDGGAYFLTLRLADSLPASVIALIADRKQRIDAAVRSGRPLLPVESVTRSELSAKRIEEVLDSGHGSCALRSSAVAQVVAHALRFWNGQRYELAAYCIMPNHVHAVVRLQHGEALSEVVGSWKSYTAKEANRILNRTRHFWEREYYDRLIRNGSELDRAVDYVLRNPERAGLKDWPWVHVDNELCARMLVGSQGQG